MICALNEVAAGLWINKRNGKPCKMESTRTSDHPRKANKPRKCRICRQEFMPRSMSHVCCSIECSVFLARQKRESAEKAQKKAERKEIEARKEKIKSRSDWAKDTQSAVNAFVRYRDRDLPCISCGRHHEGQWHCGHYLSRGAHPELAYVELNLAKQCQPCNTHLSGNQVNFRKGLIERIGIAAVEWLEGPHDPKKYTIDELRDLRDHYRAKLRALKLQHE